MKAKKKPLETVSPDDLGVDIEKKVFITGYELPPARAAGEIVEDVDTLVDRLKNKARVI